MEVRKINFYYFTGTGNTLLVVREMTKFFHKQGITVKLLQIEKEDPKNMDLDAVIGIAFPVAVFTTYPLVMRFIDGMPNADGTKVFMVDTMGGMSMGIVSAIGSKLRKKGYNTIAAKQIVMPDNFWPSTEKDVNNPSILNKAFSKTQKYANDILEDKGHWRICHVLPKISYPLSQRVFRMNSFRNAVKFVKDRCTKCGLCAKLCPVNNIVIRDYPAFDGRCELCMRCVSFCPKGAIYRKRMGEHVYRGVKAEELL